MLCFLLRLSWQWTLGFRMTASTISTLTFHTPPSFLSSHSTQLNPRLHCHVWCVCVFVRGGADPYDDCLSLTFFFFFLCFVLSSSQGMGSPLLLGTASPPLLGTASRHHSPTASLLPPAPGVPATRPCSRATKLRPPRAATEATDTATHLVDTTGTTTATATSQRGEGEGGEGTPGQIATRTLQTTTGKRFDSMTHARIYPHLSAALFDRLNRKWKSNSSTMAGACLSLFVIITDILYLLDPTMCYPVFLSLFQSRPRNMLWVMLCWAGLCV